MGALAVGTTARKKFHCQCMLEDGREVYLSVKARDEAEASEKVHAGYAVEYVLDILTPLQLEYKKRHLKRSTLTAVALN